MESETCSSKPKENWSTQHEFPAASNFPIACIFPHSKVKLEKDGESCAMKNKCFLFHIFSRLAFSIFQAVFLSMRKWKFELSDERGFPRGNLEFLSPIVDLATLVSPKHTRCWKFSFIIFTIFTIFPPNFHIFLFLFFDIGKTTQRRKKNKNNWKKLKFSLKRQSVVWSRWV